MGLAMVAPTAEQATAGKLAAQVVCHVCKRPTAKPKRGPTPTRHKGWCRELDDSLSRVRGSLDGAPSLRPEAIKALRKRLWSLANLLNGCEVDNA